MECWDSGRDTSPGLKVGEGQTRWREQLRQRHNGLEFPEASVWDCKWGELVGVGPCGHDVVLFLEASDPQVFQVRRSSPDNS